MTYLGRPGQTEISATATTETFTGNGGTTFTLAKALRDDNASFLEVFVSNVQQQPAVSYSIVGTSLTFAEAPGPGEPIYVIFRDYTAAPIFTVPDAAITESKLSSASVTVNKIGTGAVINAKLATDAVTAVKIQNDAVTEVKIATNAVTAVKIAANAVTEVKITANAVTAVKIADASINLSGTKVTGILPVANGGTGGTATLTAGGIVFGTGTAQAVSAAGTIGQVLTSNGASAPNFVTLSTGPGDHQVLLRTGNGVGSSGTKIRRFTTTVLNTGTAITFADSSADGASFTINEAGIYAIIYSDASSSATGFYGVSVNQPTLTTNIFSVPNANTIGFITIVVSGSATPTSFSTVFRFAASDVVRPCIGNTVDGTDSTIRFYITKIAS